MAKKITAIPATKSRFTAQPLVNPGKRKVCGYARVSSDHEDQESSYEAQMDYYEKYIKSRADWEFAGMYSDEAITGTSTKKRDGFNRMVKDALAGKIDLIITKSVSRFARNTVDSLTTIRELKEHGTEVFFEKENIWTFDAKGELLITIMSSLAQEEARSISENTTWGRRKQFADGKASINFGMFLGYEKGPNGEWVINEDQAVTVRLIYKLCLSGLSFDAIAKELMARGHKAPGGGDKWYAETVQSILTNEKYKGDALLQKSYTADFLTKKMVPNNGEVPQYYVEGHHKPIIEPQKFDLVQHEIERRKALGKRYSGMNIFSSKIICGECGYRYGSKVWHSNSKYRKVVWRCNGKYYMPTKCQTRHLSEDDIKDAFVKAYNKMVGEGDSVLEDLEVLKTIRCDTTEFKKRLKILTPELERIVKQTEKLIEENARKAQSQADYEERYNALATEYEEKKAEFDSLNEKIESAKVAEAAIDDFKVVFLSHRVMLTEFDEELWGCMVESITVQIDGMLLVKFKSGYEVTVE